MSDDSISQKAVTESQELAREIVLRLTESDYALIEHMANTEDLEITEYVRRHVFIGLRPLDSGS